MQWSLYEIIHIKIGKLTAMIILHFQLSCSCYNPIHETDISLQDDVRNFKVENGGSQ